MRKRCVVGIDPSLTGFAMVAMYENGTTVEKELSTKAPKVRSLSNRMKRIDYLTDAAEEFVREHVCELCVIEAYAFGAKGRSVFDLAELGGLLRSKVIGYPDSTVEVSPTTLKRFLTGRGNANKMDVMQKLVRRFDREFKTDNIADAFGLAFLASLVVGFRKPASQFERDAVGITEKLIQQET